MLRYTPPDISDRHFVLYVICRLAIIVAVGLFILASAHGAGFPPVIGIASAIAGQLLIGLIFDYCARFYYNRKE